MKILMVDDHALIRGGIRTTLSGHFKNAQFSEASNASEAMQLMRKGPWDVVILDIGLPGRDGLDVLAEIKQMAPQTSVLMLSMYPEEQFALRALKSGASGYLTKETAVDDLVNAVEKALRGEKYVSPTLAHKLAFVLIEGHDKPPHESLTDREYQILCLVASGKSVSEIAEELLLSVKTVSTHRANILRKMELKNNADMMRYAMKNGLVT